MVQEEQELTFHNQLDDSRSSLDSLESFYDSWAENYDTILSSNVTLINDYVAQRFSDFFPSKEEVAVLDVPCGTGFTGAALRKTGLNIVDGSDLSEGMLKEARRKDVYRNLFKSCITATSNLKYSEDTYDGVTCALGITRGHLQLDHALREFLRVCKVKGVIAFTINLSIPMREIMALLSKLVEEEKIELCLLEKRAYDRKRGEDQECHFGIIRRIK